MYGTKQMQIKPTTVFCKNRAVINRLNPHEPCGGS
nr:MAG TPA_asm: hypothetical protein [Bacteriophage sp.]